MLTAWMFVGAEYSCPNWAAPPYGRLYHPQEKQLMVCVSFWRNFPMFNGIWTSTELKWRPSPCNPLCANHHTVIIPDTDPTKVPYVISYRLQGNRIIHHFLSGPQFMDGSKNWQWRSWFKQMFIPMGMLNKWFNRHRRNMVENDTWK